MSIPTFIDLSEQDQCQELRQYLVDHGAAISPKATSDLRTSLNDLISGCDVVFQDKESDAESVLNSVVSLLIQVPQDDAVCGKLVSAFCAKLQTAPPKLASVVLRVLTNLFEGLGTNRSLKYQVYLALIKFAGASGNIGLVSTDVNQIKTWFAGGSVEDLQNLYRNLHEQLIANKKSEQASNIMVELLASYTEETASQARSDAEKCIVSSLADPNTFLMDHLLTLKPVKILEGELIHALLTIFVSEKLQAYVNFYNTNKQFVEKLGLNHEQNLKKIRLLTFMQMAETRKEITYATIQQELQLEEGSVEAFVIDGKSIIEFFY